MSIRQGRPIWLSRRERGRDGHAVLTAPRHECGIETRFSTANAMSIGSISFWQQDVNFWNRGAVQDQATAQQNAVNSVMSAAITNLSSGLASLANQTALSRVNNALVAAVQSALQSQTGGTTSSPSTASPSTAASASTSGSSSSSSSSSAVAAPPSPATGTGTVPLTAGTSLFTLGVLRNGKITVSDGANTTTYTSTGSDTAGDLINAINATGTKGRANVTASLNSNGQLVLTSGNQTNTISVGGIYAANIGFATGHSSFQPVVPPPSSSSTGTSASSSTGSGSNATGGSTSASGSTSAASGIPNNSALALQTGGTAAILLASNGGAGSIVNLLA